MWPSASISPQRIGTRSTRTSLPSSFFIVVYTGTPFWRHAKAFIIRDGA